MSDTNPQANHWHKLARLQSRIEHLRKASAENALQEAITAELVEVERLQAKLQRIESQTVDLHWPQFNG